MKTQSILTIIFFAIIIVAAVYLYYQLWKEEREKAERNYVERYNYASSFLTFCKSNNDFRGVHHDTMTKLIAGLRLMPGRISEDIDVLETETRRCFMKVVLQKYLDNPVRKVKRAKKIAKVEMIER